MPYQNPISQYYDTNQVLYTLFYSKGTNGLHYGFWDEQTTTHPESLMNTTRFVADCLAPEQKDKILDAGCGIGGSSLYLAQHYGVMVTGLTLSSVQLRKANAKASQASLQHKVRFLQRDYTQTGFKKGSFTKVFALESACHSSKKIDFLLEASRVLKGGGRIVVADYFHTKTEMTRGERKTYARWLHGWAIPHLATVDGFARDLRAAGFKNIAYHDKLKVIRKSRDRVYRIGLYGYPFSWLLHRLGIISRTMHDHTLSCIDQRKVFDEDEGLATYGVFVAEK